MGGQDQRASLGIPDFKYIDYPSFMKEETEKNYTTKFPKITICLNSMHSLEKLLRYREEPEVEPEVRSGMTGSKNVFQILSENGQCDIKSPNK